MTYADQFARSQDIAGKVTRVFQKRAQTAQQQYGERVRAAGKHLLENGHASSNGYDYAVDVFQRSILFWDTLRRRGNQFVEQAKRGSEPVLHFEYEMLLDGRGFSRPVNYALLRIVPPQGVVIDDKKRPYLIIDPRAGHGPGIGGFKDDSQVGVALRAGHPVYFVTFFRDPQPGQTLLDVCAAEQRFVKHVRALHPESRKPAIVGNCQGGWAAMMLASSEPDETGPLVINGAPMSYWSGAWSEGDGDNPMRYSGGMLGGTWLASFTADLGNGKFDGAHLVQNFESLNPANSLWDKYYHLYANIDSEPPRFLDFERWWGAYYLMNRDEIEWITRNLFVGNKLWSGEVRGMEGVSFDLRAIKSPIVLFASLGDNITPPQQAFNWVADVYGSTEEIKSRGQVIVGLMHQDIGHLGIFVSGKVAKKEYTQIASVLEAIESFPPGLYGMEIAERKTADGTTEYDVTFREHRLEEVVARFNRFERIDELPFKAVQQVSDFNQRAYELFAQPFVQAMSNDVTATWLRQFHPLRAQRWMVSDMNPWLAWLGPAADAVKAARKPDAAPGAWHAVEHFGSDMRARASTSIARCAMPLPRASSSPSTETCSRRITRKPPMAARPGTNRPIRAICRSCRKRWRGSRVAAIRRRSRVSRVCWCSMTCRFRSHACCCGRNSRESTRSTCHRCRPTHGGGCAASRRSSCGWSPGRRSRHCRSYFAILMIERSF